MVRERINLEKLRKLLPDEEEFVCLSDDHLTNRSGPVPAELNSYNENDVIVARERVKDFKEWLD